MVRPAGLAESAQSPWVEKEGSPIGWPTKSGERILPVLPRRDVGVETASETSRRRRPLSLYALRGALREEPRHLTWPGPTTRPPRPAQHSSFRLRGGRPGRADARRLERDELEGEEHLLAPPGRRLAQVAWPRSPCS